MSLFSINAADIDVAGRSIDADLPVDWLDKQLAECDVRATEPGKMSVRLSRSGEDIVVRGKTHAVLQVPCARCLTPTNLNLDGDLTLVLRPAKPSTSEGSASAARGARGAAARGSASKTSTSKTSTSKTSTSKDVVTVVVTGTATGSGKGKRPPKEKDLPEYEFAADEADVDTYDGETVVLDDLVRESILLEIPIFPLCSEDCAGIRPASSDMIDEGEEPRIDPRLAPLGALRAVLAQSKAAQGELTDDSGAQPRSAHASHRKKTK